MCEALGLIPSTTKNQTKQKDRKEERKNQPFMKSQKNSR
jgi:hypothetical protein